jgi:hypothetical protein
MKNILFAALQFVLFFVAFAVGSFAVPFHLRQVLSVTAEGTRVFIWDGLVLMLGLAVVILIVEAMRKRLMSAAPGTMIALVLAAVAGIVLRLGFLTVPGGI